MDDRNVNLVGIYAETACNGVESIVLLDASGVEHEVQTPAQLWAAVHEILNDDTLPNPERNPGFDPAAQTVSSDEIYDGVVHHVEGIVTDTAGPIFGRLASVLIRNKGADAINFLRQISRDD